MQIDIQASNIKCEGCAGIITEKLGADARVASIAVDVASGTVSIESEAELESWAREQLAALGYPPVAA
jgi:copper chaperone CopZ